MVEIETEAGRHRLWAGDLADVPALVAAGLFQAGPHPLRLGRPDEIPFLARQTRLTFTRCGLIDPRSLDDYHAAGGFRGWERARA